MGDISGQAVASGAGLYEMMHGGRGTYTMDRAHDAANAQAGEQDKINGEVAAIAGRLESAWTGKAADGAQAATRPLMDGARQSAEALERARRVHSDQGGQFVHARDKMEKVPANPPETNAYDTLTPWDTDTEDAVNRYNDASANNVRLYDEYGKTSSANEAAMPQQYAHFPAFGGEFSVAKPHQPDGSTHVSSSSVPYPGGGGGGAGGYVPGPGGGTGGYSGSPQSPGSVGSAPLPGVGGGVQPGPGGTTGAAPLGPGYTGNPAAGLRPGAPGFGPEGMLGAGVVPGGGGDTARGSRGFGAKGARAGGAGAIEEEAAARNAAAAERAAGRAAAGGRVAAGPGAAAAAEAAAARGAASGGAKGGAGGAPVGGAGGKKDEDKEHKRKTVLEEADAEGTFGLGQRTPPPVIGEQR